MSNDDAREAMGDRAAAKSTTEVPSEVGANATGLAPDLSDTSISSSRSSVTASSNVGDDRHHGHRDENERALKTPAPPPSAAVLAQLARQLEYYFSSRNLARDTYVQTLRSLNDGCVPVAILANFAKVKAIVQVADEESRFHAILQATAEHSELLHVCSIETSTGTIATDDTPSSATTILAVGPVGREPLVLNEDDVAVVGDALPLRTSPSVASLVSSSAASHELSSPRSTASGGTTNTIILREVHPDVTEAEVRDLFRFEGCPAVESVRPDVAHCWFISLDTSSRDDMLRVMMTIRMQVLHGDYVQARLKATATAPIETAPPMPLWPAVTPEMLALQSTLDAKKKRKKKRKNRKKATGASKPTQLPTIGGSPASSSEKKVEAPPSMGEDDFPTIQVKKVEFVTMPKDDKPDEEEERTKSLSSDAASTATTNSSSLDSFAKPKPFTGYAAALLKAPSPVTITEPLSPSSTGTAKNVKRVPSLSGALDTISDLRDALATSRSPGVGPPVNVTPPIWGRGRSFADILREERARPTPS